MSIFETIGLIGLIFGLVGTAIGVSNYLRDRAKVIITLQWDVAVTGEDKNKKFGCIAITNTGRRTIFILHVALRLPKGGEHFHFLIREGLKGQRLSESDAPAAYPIEQGGLEKYENNWRNIIAQVSDSTTIKESIKATAIQTPLILKEWLHKVCNVSVLSGEDQLPFAALSPSPHLGHYVIRGSTR